MSPIRPVLGLRTDPLVGGKWDTLRGTHRFRAPDCLCTSLVHETSMVGTTRNYRSNDLESAMCRHMSAPAKLAAQPVVESTIHGDMLVPRKVKFAKR